ncbi:P-loop containing nucleoside triphosphate hydrolase protein [Talaromyces proteolyticus]|uniref:GTP-binding protein 8 n=1 Tax=Talaromyces proteolyticus TaxID=1131652 RepID=A0AAD4L054_9EURO|nr:P-loop containing nucleoside triphosphate hydrolase protein [Talaromyces proteolyticus]KAH8701666.1 P-loop containing nucleoside triphosphate hydrolase protein [Talaromyces proteolyticus]
MLGRPSICASCLAGFRNVSRLQKQQLHQSKRSKSNQSKSNKSKSIAHSLPTNITKIIPFTDLQPTDIARYWDTIPPEASNLAYADKFFTPSRHSPVKLFSAAKFRTIPFDSTEPEVAFIGRSNVGKSSIINALVGQEVCWVSKHPGKTTEMNAFGIGGKKGGESKIVLLDMPGYGKASRTEWGIEIMKYLQQRKQLRRTYLLIDSLHGIKDNDQEILSLLRRYGISHQIILSKVDRVLAGRLNKGLKLFSRGYEVRSSRLNHLQKMLKKMEPILQPPDSRVDGPGALGEILTCTSAAKVSQESQNCLGVSNIRWSILKATGFDGSIETGASREMSPIQSAEDRPTLSTPVQ